MTPGDQDNVRHAIKTQSKLLSEGEPAFDMFGDPLAEFSPYNSVLALSLYWED